VAGCNPQTEILKIFANQGLTLLEPARDYVSIGGIVVLPKGGNRLQYIDPYDVLTPATGTSTNFNAVIHSQTDTTSAGAQFAAALSQIVSLPIGFSFNTGQTIKLTQIDSSGQRYTSPMISTLLKKPETSAQIIPRLQEGDRVFIIQEVYTAKSLSVSSTTTTALAANVGGSPIGNNCNSAQQAGGQKGSAQQGGGQQAVGQQAGAQQSGGQQAVGQQAGAKEGVSVGVCRNTDAELTFSSQAPIPFAVRLNEVQLGPGGVVEVKSTGFKLPNLALGNASDVKATVLIDQQNPTLGALEHITH
jgi:hypothetical protein